MALTGGEDDIPAHFYSSCPQLVRQQSVRLPLCSQLMSHTPARSSRSSFLTLWCACVSLVACGGGETPTTPPTTQPPIARVLEIGAESPTSVSRAEVATFSLQERLAGGGVSPVAVGEAVWSVVASGGRARVLAPGRIRAASVGLVLVRATIGARTAERTLAIQPNLRARLEAVGADADTLDLATPVVVGLREVLASGAVDTLAVTAQSWRVRGDSSAATVAVSGATWVITPRAVGIVTLQATAGTDTLEIVRPVAAVQPVALAWPADAPNTLAMLDTLTLTVLATYADGRTDTLLTPRITWSVENGSGRATLLPPNRVRADADGIVRVRASAGPVTIVRDLSIATNQPTSLTATPAVPSTLASGDSVVLAIRLTDRDGLLARRPLEVFSADTTRLVARSVPTSGGHQTATQVVVLRGVRVGVVELTMRADTLVRRYTVQVTPVALVPVMPVGARLIVALGDSVFLPDTLRLYDRGLRQVVGAPAAAVWMSQSERVMVSGGIGYAAAVGVDTLRAALAVTQDGVAETVTASLPVEVQDIAVDPFEVMVDSTIPAPMRAEIRAIIRSFARVFTAPPPLATRSLADSLSVTGLCAGRVVATSLVTKPHAIVIDVMAPPGAVVQALARGGLCKTRAALSAGQQAGAYQTWLGGVWIAEETVAQYWATWGDLRRRERFRNIVLHELMHALGIGTGSLLSPFSEAAVFRGPMAMAAYAAAGGVGPVPMTAEGAHLDPATFGVPISPLALQRLFQPSVAAVMTPTIATFLALTPVTVGVLGDLGYTLDVTRVAAYSLPLRAEERFTALYGSLTATFSAWIADISPKMDSVALLEGLPVVDGSNR